jgi:hypothetical protein
MNHILLVVWPLCIFQYAWGADQPPQLSDKYGLAMKISMIGEVVPDEAKITWDAQNTFIEGQQVAIKSSNKTVQFGVVQARVSDKRVVWTEISQIDGKTTHTGRVFDLKDIGKFSEECVVLESYVGELVDKQLCMFVDWDATIYTQGEIVAVKRSDKSVKYGKIGPNNLWLVWRKDANGGTFTQVFRAENIGKIAFD